MEEQGNPSREKGSDPFVLFRLDYTENVWLKGGAASINR